VLGHENVGEVGSWRGGQAEFLRVPWGDFNCLRLLEDAREKQNGYVMLSDVWPTGYHAAEVANVGPGDSVVDYKASPVDQVIGHGEGADCGCECVGDQAHDPQGHEHSDATLNNW
jgi:glutathione-independent formaldehyde dehydrogenase